MGLGSGKAGSADSAITSSEEEDFTRNNIDLSFVHHHISVVRWAEIVLFYVIDYG